MSTSTNVKSNTNVKTNTKNPQGFTFFVKHKSIPSGMMMSAPKIDLSKPVIKFRANSSTAKKGGKTQRKRRVSKRRVSKRRVSKKRVSKRTQRKKK
jgi:hypothetical protein